MCGFVGFVNYKQNILDKNILLKSVIEEVIYYKEKGINLNTQ